MSHRRHHGHHRGCSPLCTSVRHELLDLANHLRQERLYVQHEKVQLQELSAKVRTASEKLSHTAWIAHQQRENLDGLIFSSRGLDTSPSNCCMRANILEKTIFQDAYKHLGHQEILYSEFLRVLRGKSKLLAHTLTAGDKMSLPQMPEVISTIFSGLYGSCIMADDERLVLRLLRHLMKIQLTSAANPRKLLRQGNCAFSRIYKALSEELFSAKLFLTAALYEPILSLLSDDEIFLDIDPTKTVIRFPPSERLKKFGREGTPEYIRNVKQHRTFVVSKLEALTNSFIQGIRENLHCFPPSLARLLRSMYRLLMSSGRAEPREVNAVCVDVIFYLFICPAMVDPNPVGIIDTPISYIARSNLMQVAQILQVLAMWKWEEIDPRLMDLYSRFDKEAMSTVLEVMLESANDLGTSDDDEDFTEAEEQEVNPAGLNNSHSEQPLNHDVNIDSPASTPRITRMAVLLTRGQLDQLISFLRQIRDAGTSPDLFNGVDIDLRELNEILGPLPEVVPGQHSPGTHHSFQSKTLQPTSSTPSGTPNKVPTVSKSEDSLVALATAKKQLLTHKLSNVATRASALSSNLRSATSNPVSPEEVGGKQVETNGPDNVDGSVPSLSKSDSYHSGDHSFEADPEVVMVIPLFQGRSDEPPGFLSEEHVISRSRQSSGSRVVRMNLANLPGDEDSGRHGRHTGANGSGGVGGGNSEENSSLVSGGAGEKRTRFSLSHDDGSIGNTSDNLEAISEAASNHSVDSSLEDEDDPVEDPIIDNLSDMVSANVSGRGTPNVSGRDTPSSQVTEGDELVGGAGGRDVGGPERVEEAPEEPRDEVRGGVNVQHQQPHPHRGPTEGDPTSGGNRGRKNGEPDLEEKFGRFEIKPQSRSVGQGGQNMSMTGAAGSEQGDETISMVSDTWSTDVLASDTETLGEDGIHHQILLLHQRRHGRGLGQGIGVQVDRGLLDDLVEHHERLGSSGNETSGGQTIRPGMEGSGGSLGSASAANLLDVSETCSEAWSIDVLASDTESLRMAEVDNEDTASVARSDDTRFTDDTTRSDPEPLDLSGVGNLSGGQASSGILGGPSHAARYRRDDVTMIKRGLSYDGNLLRPSRVAAVEQWARQSGGPRTGLIPRRGSECSGGRPNIAQDGAKPKLVSTVSETDSGARPSDVAASGATPLAFITSHLSATSIASSTESSAGESGTGFSVTTVAGTAGEPPIYSNSATPDNNSLSNNPEDESLRCLIDGELEISAASSVPPTVESSSSSNSSTKPVDKVVKPSPAPNTGAIPKSISFDKNVGRNHRHNSHNPSSPQGAGSSEWLESARESGDHGHLNHQGAKHKKRDNSFFKSWKLPKIGRNRNLPGPIPAVQQQASPGGRNKPDFRFSGEESGTIDGLATEQLPHSGVQPDEQSESHVETSDDILAKYRKRAPPPNEEDLGLSNSNEVILHEGSRSRDEGEMSNDDDSRLVIDPQNVEASFAFQDAKRKLRMMLSEADLSILSSLPMTSSSGKSRNNNELVWILRVQLAEAHNLQDRNLVAQLHETLRCLSLFDNENCRKLIRSLREDYKRRSPYLSYLVRCRQGLLTTLAQQERLLSRMEMDQKVCTAYLVSVCIRIFLERHEADLSAFVTEFKEVSASDEKITLMERFLASTWAKLESDSTSIIWSLMVSEEQQDLCRLTIERAVVSQIYVHAMYPNGEADISRDDVLSQHIRRLSDEITPGHRDLRIPRQYHYEQPWPSAQAELRRLAAYKTPQDKVCCVVRCSQTIMNLLSIASSKSVPAADDFIPVMVFVIIKANPPSLLSTVQYVDAFYGNRLCGEEQYWWMQFASAIEFIKTMDYQTQR